MQRLLLLLIVFAANVALANPHSLITPKQLKSSKRLCEGTWPKAKKPSRKTTDLCLQYWLFTHPYDLKEAQENFDSALSLDPISSGGGAFLSETFAKMAAHVKRQYPKPDENDWLIRRAIEYFEASAESNLSLTDMNACDDGQLDCMLRELLAGRPLRHDLEPLEAATLWKLRNAVYARHGRKFKHPDLNRFFYEGTSRARGLLPLKINPKFRDSMLSKVDRANVQLILKAERR